jgi:competence protein ComEC
VIALQEAGVERVDVLAPSHAHADHMGGCYHVMNQFAVGEVLWTGQTDPSTTWRTFWGQVEASGVPVTQLAVGQTFDWGGGVTARVYNPPDHANGAPFDEYEDSHVLLVEHGSVRFLFTGDLHARGEAMALAAGLPSVDVLKVAEHGSKSGSGQGFLDAVSPDLAVISAGPRNAHGHPHPEVLTRLGGVGARVLVTAQTGSVTVTSDGQTYAVAVEREAAGPPPAPVPAPPPPAPEPAPPAPAAGTCDPSYPDVCIPPPPPDLDCPQVPHRDFRVLPPDPHRFDAARDGIGCER